jgi:hypothetical protein
LNMRAKLSSSEALNVATRYWSGHRPRNVLGFLLSGEGEVA